MDVQTIEQLAMLAVMAAEHPGKTLPPHQPSSGDADAVACGPGDGASGGH